MRITDVDPACLDDSDSHADVGRETLQPFLFATAN